MVQTFKKDFNLPLKLIEWKNLQPESPFFKPGFYLFQNHCLTSRKMRIILKTPHQPPRFTLKSDLGVPKGMKVDGKVT